MSAESLLASGICKYGSLNVTTNREVLEKYYGVTNLYKRLEIGIERKRLCLDELLSEGKKLSVGWYYYKYRLFYDCETVAELINMLKVDTEWGTPKNTIKARVLSRDLQHTSYYVDIPKSANITLVEDVTRLMPKEYVYYAISKNFGYTSCTVKAGSIELAREYGYAEFSRCYGSTDKYMGLECNGKVIEGIVIKGISIDRQRELCQSLMWGYVNQFPNYSKAVKEIASGVGVQIEDDHIRYLFVNNLARVTKEPNMVDVGYTLAVFLDKCKTKAIADDLLKTEYMRLAHGIVEKQLFRLINDTSVIVNNKTTVYVGDNSFIVFDTPNKSIGDYAEVTYNGVYLGKINIKPYKR